MLLKDLNNKNDDFFMLQAYKEAKLAFANNEVPVGAVIVHNNIIIARSHNLSEKLRDFTAHAEMQVFTLASNYLKSKYLNSCTLYITLEPCIMCAGACFWTRIGKIVYGSEDKKRGYSTVSPNILHPSTIVSSGILKEECSKLLKDFFLSKRKKE